MLKAALCAESMPESTGKLKIRTLNVRKTTKNLVDCNYIRTFAVEILQNSSIIQKYESKRFYILVVAQLKNPKFVSR